MSNDYVISKRIDKSMAVISWFVTVLVFFMVVAGFIYTGIRVFEFDISTTIFFFFMYSVPILLLAWMITHHKKKRPPQQEKDRETPRPYKVDDCPACGRPFMGRPVCICGYQFPNTRLELA